MSFGSPPPGFSVADRIRVRAEEPAVEDPPVEDASDCKSDPFLEAHRLEKVAPDGNCFDFVLLPGAKNGKPGMKEKPQTRFRFWQR